MASNMPVKLVLEGTSRISLNERWGDKLTVDQVYTDPIRNMYSAIRSMISSLMTWFIRQSSDWLVIL